MSGEIFNQTGFKRDLNTLKNMVSQRIMNDMRLDCFQFGVDFGMLYSKMMNKLTQNPTGRLSADDRIQLHPIGQLCVQYRDYMMKACRPPTLGPDKDKGVADFLWYADERFDAIIQNLQRLTIEKR
tara:strand:+ start:8131 stop:8508 length:378 start_codon:yes stop_codon:yes gene_type:complete